MSAIAHNRNNHTIINRPVHSVGIGYGACVMGRNTKELILATAFDILSKDGAASINSIIAAAGLSKGVFFHHFRSKQELLLELAERDFASRVERVKACAKALPDAPGRMVRAYIFAWIECAAFSGQKLLNALRALNDPVLRERLAEQQKHLFDLIWDPALSEATMKVIMNACAGSMLLTIMSDKSLDEITESRKELAEELFRIIELSLRTAGAKHE